MNTLINRRTFIKQSSMAGAAAAASTLAFSAKSFASIKGANEKLQVAIFGCKRRFGGIVDAIHHTPGMQIRSICDVHAINLADGLKKVVETCGYEPETYVDLRKALEDKEVDAVFVLLPDHWHAYASYLALESGKHVYVEKPCSHNLGESEMFQKWEQDYGKKIQMGTQQRSSLESVEIVKQIHDGIIGTPYLAKAFYSNSRGRVANPQQVPVPEHFNWDLFQGPAPRRPFLDIVEDYNWHWFWHWGTAETGNNATHELDIARWALQVTYPERVMVNAGKRHFIDDGWTMYDTMDASFQFPGGSAIQWDGKSRNG